MFSDNKNKMSPDSVKEQNRISQGTKITGDIVSKGGLRVEGIIEGNITTPGKVVVGKVGQIIGTLECENADFEGRFTGKLLISGTLTLRSTAVIEGEVEVGKLVVEQGANFNATCVMKAGVKSINNERGGRKEEKSA
ncbi:MAG TPA: polymer-forming cytoskeletal protein [Salinimicrobium sp.]|nr:polymer-forming cytoskeletal protein [Salinimicrobium sp.]